MDPKSINNNTRRELTPSHSPEPPTTGRAWRQRHQYLVSRAHLPVSLAKLRILKALFLLVQILYRVLLTLLRYCLFSKHVLPVLDSSSLGLRIRLVFRTVFMFLLFGSMSYYEFFMGMAIQVTEWNMWGEQKWDVRTTYLIGRGGARLLRLGFLVASCGKYGGCSGGSRSGHLCALDLGGVGKQFRNRGRLDVRVVL